MDSRLFFSDGDLLSIEGKIGYTFSDKRLLCTAFCHSSFAHEKGVQSYERLEFLGDSVVNFVVGERLFHKYPKASEGFLTKVRSKIVRTEALSGAIDSMDVIGHMLTSGGLISEQVRSNSHIKEDLFEAICGGILEDGGLESSRSFVLRSLQSLIDADYSTSSVTDYKTTVLELCAKQKKKAVFECISLGDGGFLASLYIDGAKLSMGEGTSKNRAMQSASEKYIKTLNG